MLICRASYYRTVQRGRTGEYCPGIAAANHNTELPKAATLGNSTL